MLRQREIYTNARTCQSWGPLTNREMLVVFQHSNSSPAPTRETHQGIKFYFHVWNFFEWIPINVNMPWWTSPVRLAFSLEISHIHIVMHAPIHTQCIYSLASGCKSLLFLSIFAFFHFLLLYYIFFVVKDYFLTHCALSWPEIRRVVNLPSVTRRWTTKGAAVTCLCHKKTDDWWAAVAWGDKRCRWWLLDWVLVSPLASLY